MRNHSPHLGSRILRGGVAVAFALAATVAMKPAAAHPAHRHTTVHRTVTYVQPVHEVRYVEPAVVVPRHISRRTFVSYRRYYQGSVRHPGHGHRHSVYAFPVRHGHRVRYRAHSYCSGSLFEVGFSTRHGHFELGFRH